MTVFDPDDPQFDDYPYPGEPTPGEYCQHNQPDPTPARRRDDHDRAAARSTATTAATRKEPT